MGMVTLVGTCHVFNLKERVKSIIKSNPPDAVCVELDKKRFERLKSPLSYPTGLLSLMQKLIAMRYETTPGNDMLGAIEGADEMGIPLFLIDKDIDTLVGKLREAFIREFLNPFELMRKLLVSMNIEWNQLSLLYDRDVVEFFVYDFTENPDKYRNQFELFFPFFKKILLDEREENMANKIRELSKKYESIIAVVGAGHISGLEKLLPDLKIQSIVLVEK
jgi:pheromone shutdown protein TraB